MSTKAQISEQLIFILGPPRSGTTLLLAILVNDQPKIAGSTFESQLYNLHAASDYSWEAIAKNEFYQDLLDATELKNLFDQQTNYLDFFTACVEVKIKKEGASYFCEKYPPHVLWYKEIARDFPHSKWILLTRNPAAGIHSYATTKFPWWRIWADQLPLGMSKWKWIRYLNAMVIYYDYHLCMKRISVHPNCSMIISFEDLVTSPEKFRQEFEQKMGIQLNDLKPSAPSSVVLPNEKEKKFHPQAGTAFKKQMPNWTLKMSERIFLPQKGAGKIQQALLIAFIITPLRLGKKIVSMGRKSRS